MLKLNEGSIVLIMLFIYLVAALGVINTMLMSVLERTREIGVLKAIGMRGSGVLRMIVTETTALAVISAVIGAGLGLLLNAYLARYGIDLSSSSESFTLGGVGFKPVFKAVITARGTLVPVVVLTISCCLASLYPAIRAALLAPAAGMREL